MRKIAPITATGTATTAVTRPISSVPMIAWRAPPPARRSVVPARSCVHHDADRIAGSPSETMLTRIQTSGTIAMRALR
jgi:hypothetical protein